MAGRKARTTEQTQQARERVLRAALDLAAVQGYDATTIAQVAAAAGESESFVFWHFRNKETLLADALEYGYRQGFGSGAVWSDAPTPERRRGSLLENMTMRGGEPILTSPYWRLGLTLALEQRSKEPAARVRFLGVRTDAHELLEQWWLSALERPSLAERPELAAILSRVTLAALDGFAMWRSVDAPDSRPRLETPARAMLADGLHAVALAYEHGAAPQWPAVGREASGSTAARAVGGATEPVDPRAAFLAAAEVATAAGGLEMATVSRICELAKLPVSSFYWWFDDKESLITAVVERVHRRWSGRLQPLPAPGSASRYDLLLAAASRSLHAHAQEPSMLRISSMLLLMTNPSSPGAARQLVSDLRQQAYEEFRQWVAHVVSPEVLAVSPDFCADLARVNQVMIDGLFFAAQIDDDARPLDDHAWMLATMLDAVIRSAETGAPVDGADAGAARVIDV